MKFFSSSIIRGRPLKTADNVEPAYRTIWEKSIIKLTDEMDERDVEITRKCNKFADFQGLIARVIPKFSADFWVRINEVLGYSMLILGLDLDTSVYWGMLLSYFMQIAKYEVDHHPTLIFFYDIADIYESYRSDYAMLKSDGSLKWTRKMYFEARLVELRLLADGLKGYRLPKFKNSSKVAEEHTTRYKTTISRLWQDKKPMITIDKKEVFKSSLKQNPKSGVRFYSAMVELEFFLDRLLGMGYKYGDHSELTPRPGTLKSAVVYGIGGVGKYTLVSAYAKSLYKAKQIEILLSVDCTSLETIRAAFRSFAKRYGLISGNATDGKVRSRALKFLVSEPKHSKWLLIYRNVRQPELIQPYWPAAPHGCIIITARSPSIVSQYTRRSVEVTPWNPKWGRLYLSLYCQKYGLTFLKSEGQAAYNLSEWLGGHPKALARMADLMKSERLSVEELCYDYQKNPQRYHSDPGLKAIWKPEFESLDRSCRRLLGIISFLNVNLLREELFINIPMQRRSQDQFYDCKEMSYELNINILEQLDLLERSQITNVLLVSPMVQQQFKVFLPLEERQQAFMNSVNLIRYAIFLSTHGYKDTGPGPNTSRKEIGKVLKRRYLPHIQTFITNFYQLDKKEDPAFYEKIFQRLSDLDKNAAKWCDDGHGVRNVRFSEHAEFFR